jgi:[ribosomal protein S5]-alanine N-acetyltransferase
MVSSRAITVNVYFNSTIGLRFVYKLERKMDIDLGAWKLRNWTDDDIPALVEYANNVKVWMNLDDIFPHPYTESDAKQWIKLSGTSPVTNFAIASQVEAIGGIGFTLQSGIYKRSAAIGYWIGEPFWGKGVATLALGAIVQYAFANFDVIRLYATVFESNRASARVLEKNGFKLEGRLIKSITKNGKTMDALLYALIRDDLRPVVC